MGKKLSMKNNSKKNDLKNGFFVTYEDYYKLLADIDDVARLNRQLIEMLSERSEKFLDVKIKHPPIPYMTTSDKKSG